mmetsp:Transcript_10873/g.38145  ORF Transcript_10873/g.38145 Transcript_10873/m.38145 type:complete len:213 (+) Transcript_10873:1045-1683(+)
MVLENDLLQISLKSGKGQVGSREDQPHRVEGQIHGALPQCHECCRRNKKSGGNPLCKRNLPSQPQDTQRHGRDQLRALHYRPSCIVHVPVGDLAQGLGHGQADCGDNVQVQRGTPRFFNSVEGASLQLCTQSEANQLDESYRPIEVETWQRFENPLLHIATQSHHHDENRAEDQELPPRRENRQRHHRNKARAMQDPLYPKTESRGCVYKAL